MVAPPALVQYASLLVGHQVGVACEADRHYTDGLRGYTLEYGDGTFEQVIHLPSTSCKRLVALLTVKPKVHPATLATNGGSPVDLQAGQDVEVILHEAMHLRLASGNETCVERTTYANRWQAVAPLHLSARRDRALMRGMRVSHESMPAIYSNGSC